MDVVGTITGAVGSIPANLKIAGAVAAAYCGRKFVYAGACKAYAAITGNADADKAGNEYIKQINFTRDVGAAVLCLAGGFGGDYMLNNTPEPEIKKPEGQKSNQTTWETVSALGSWAKDGVVNADWKVYVGIGAVQDIARYASGWVLPKFTASNAVMSGGRLAGNYLFADTNPAQKPPKDPITK